MQYLEWLDRVVSAKLAEDSIGRVVFVRASLELSNDHGLLIPLVAATLEKLLGWLRSTLRRAYLQGSVQAGTVTALVECSGGQTALITAELRVPRAQPAASLLITGQQGTFRFDDLPEPAQLAPGAGPAMAGARWIREIERALATGAEIRAARE